MQKIQGSDKYGLTDAKQKECDEEVDKNLTDWRTAKLSPEEIAFNIYQDIMLKPTAKVSKAIVAQCLANILHDYENKEELKERIIQDPNLKYIVDAITYATGGVGDDGDD